MLLILYHLSEDTIINLAIAIYSLSYFIWNNFLKTKEKKLGQKTSQVGLVVKHLPANAGDIRDTSSILRSGRSPGGEHGNPLQYSCLENPHGQRNLVGFSPRAHRELDVTEAT